MHTKISRIPAAAHVFVIGSFAIDAATGTVTVAGALDFTVENDYALTVTVTDGGLLSDSAQLGISVTALDITIATGTTGNDVLTGSTTNEILLGLGGDDTYVYGPDGGQDGIEDSAGTDRIVLGSEADIARFESIGSDLVFGFADGGSLTVTDMLNGQAVEELAFAYAPGIVHALRLDAGFGDGTDWLIGGWGDDLFVFRTGDGSDRLRYFDTGAGTGDVIDLTETTLTSFADLAAIAGRAGDNVVIDFGSGDKITLINQPSIQSIRTISCSDLGCARHENRRHYGLKPNLSGSDIPERSVAAMGAGGAFVEVAQRRKLGGAWRRCLAATGRHLERPARRRHGIRRGEARMEVGQRQLAALRVGPKDADIGDHHRRTLAG